MRGTGRMRALLPMCVLLGACGPGENIAPESAGVAAVPAVHPRAAEREKMVLEQIEERGVLNEAILRAMREVPRHEFVPERFRPRAYGDHALPIGEDQTISQPYLVAVMAELADLSGDSKVLEIGTGSGYGAAVLGRVAGEVYTIEIIDALAKRAAGTLKRLGYDNVHARQGDGYRGWPEAAPFDAIIVTAAPPHVPDPLKDQLKVGGNLVVPVGTKYQSLRVIHRSREGFIDRRIFRVKFVPMTGEVEESPTDSDSR